MFYEYKYKKMNSSHLRVVFYCETDAPSNSRNQYSLQNVFTCSADIRSIDTLTDHYGNNGKIYESVHITTEPNSFRYKYLLCSIYGETTKEFRSKL
jgi:hypothetical protein